jgi:quercetin dioxygenase-like cupin family protein
VSEENADEGGEAPCFAPFLDELDVREPPARDAVLVDLDAVAAGGDGVAWHLPHDGDLDANLVRLGPAGSIGAHRNGEVDVLIVVRSGTAELDVDGTRTGLHRGSLALVPRGARRAIAAGTDGVEYLSIHRRRAGLAIGAGPAQRDQSSTR